MSASMFSVAAFGAVALAPATRFLGGTARMAQTGLVVRALLGFAMAAIVSTMMATTSRDDDNNSTRQQHILLVTAVSVLHGLAQHMTAMALTTQTTGAVTAQEQGSLLGLEHGLFSLARIAGPALGTTLLESSFWSVAAACGAIDASLVAILILTAIRASSTTTEPKAKEQ
jgi:hypothetical protein